MRRWILIALLLGVACRKPPAQDLDEDGEGDESAMEDDVPPVREPEPPALPVEGADPNAAYERGSKAYSAGDWAPAVGYFKTAFQLRPDPVFLFDIAQALRMMHDCYNAVRYYRRYLDAVPDTSSRDEAEQWLTQLLERCPDA